MEGRLVLKNCSVLGAYGRIHKHLAVIVEGGRILRVAPDAEVPILPGDWEVACRGRLVAPGLVDCHTHLVGGQLLPLSGADLLRTPPARLARQRHLDSLLTASEVEVLSAHAMARALRSGVTMLVEHLHCPKDVEGALAAQARAARRLGVRLSNSHASSSLDGLPEGIAQLEENAAFAEQLRADPLVRPALGLHSSSSCGDELLRRAGRAREAPGAVGLHYHLAESQDDAAATLERHGKRIVQRLESFGLLGAGVVAADAHAIDRSESERLMRSRTLIALGPRIGLPAELGSGLESVFAFQNLVGMGTSGTGLLWGELVSTLIGLLPIARQGGLPEPDGTLGRLLISSPAELCSLLYGAPSGAVEAGRLADLVVYDHVPAEEGAGGLTPYLLLQLGQARVAWTIVAGQVVVREGELLAHDFVGLSREAARALETLWARAGVGGGG